MIPLLAQLENKLRIILTTMAFPTAAKSPKEKTSQTTQVNVRKALSCGWDNASDGFAFIPAQVAQHVQWYPPRCSAWTMFSVHAHYRKCKRLTECHSQGYCLYPLLAVHLHGADQALKHNLPQKKTTQPAAIFKPGSLHHQGIATEISKDLQCKWVAQISFSLLMIS